jgi:hypothetical protein
MSVKTLKGVSVLQNLVGEEGFHEDGTNTWFVKSIAHGITRVRSQRHITVLLKYSQLQTVQLDAHVIITCSARNPLPDKD